MPTLHSTSQASYVLTGLLEQPNPQRHDLRPLQAYRPIHLQRGVAPTASGSAKVSLGGTEVTVAVSCQIEAVAGGNVPGPSSGQSRGGVEASVQL
jgi:exosome complex RNA-binding protein Rrp42 (RNase PH superfamily)